MSRYDVAIIGSGPAAISAALTLQTLKKNILWLGSVTLSEKIRMAERIRNYPGLSDVTGAQMQEAFLTQIEAMGLSITPKTVTGVYDMGGYFGILCDQESFEATSVILATGVESIKPIPGELEFLGRGVSYCATCDGFLYEDKSIAVVCTSADYEHEVVYLAGLAERVYLIPLYRDVTVTGDNITVVKGMPRRIEGERKASRLLFDKETLTVDGIFFLKAAISPSALVGGLATEDGHVVVDRHGATNLAGLFAAGDCTGRPYQYVKAAGEGNVAAHAAVDYLNQIQKS